jgi:hypothetical protein
MSEQADQLPLLAIALLKGVLDREDEPALWSSLLDGQARVRDYVAVIGLELMLDEAEGYAFLRSRIEAEDAPGPRLPRLLARRPLSFPVSLILALLRKKLAEFDASGGDSRLVLTLEDINELVRVFLPESSNEARLLDQLETHLNKIVELGFLRRMKTAGRQAPASFEVRRILKAYVDAHWLNEFDQRLAAYARKLAGTDAADSDDAGAGA